VQSQDLYADCTMIRAEIEANNAKAAELANEQGWKTAQNVTTGLVGLVIWPVWFGMDWKGAAAKADNARPTAIVKKTLECTATLSLKKPRFGHHPTIIGAAQGDLTLAQQLRQLSDVGSATPRLIARKQVRGTRRVGSPHSHPPSSYRSDVTPACCTFRTRPPCAQYLRAGWRQPRRVVTCEAAPEHN